jgi:hypothetical protein
VAPVGVEVVAVIVDVEARRAIRQAEVRAARTTTFAATAAVEKLPEIFAKLAPISS